MASRRVRSRASAEPSASQLTQLTIDGLIEQLGRERGKPVAWPLKPEDIGSSLLPILSQGLYNNPLDAIREYVQNGVDAHATIIRIKISGRSVTIQDNGDGMDIRELVQARQFGMSYKRLDEHVGFRGIGLYSGFHLANRLVITTKKARDTRYYVLAFSFGEMKALLDAERNDPDRPRTSLPDLLSTYSTFVEHEIDPEEVDHIRKSYTIAQLEELSEAHIAQLADRERLKDYVLKNLPIDFHPEFPYRQQIIEELNRRLGGYNPVQIELIFDGPGNTDVVRRPNIPDLHPPKMDLITNSKDEPIAFYWACRTKEPHAIDDEYQQFRGLVYKVKGFTIGDSRHIRPFFRKGSGVLHEWFTGEIYLLDSNVTPNAARDDFESGPAKEQLLLAVMEEMGRLDDEAEAARTQMRADKVFGELGATVGSLAKKIETGRFDNWTVYTELNTILQKLEGQRKRASDQPAAHALISRVKHLQKEVATQIENPNDKTRRKRRKEQQPPSDMPQGLSNEDNGIPHQETRDAGSTADSGTTPSPRSIRTLRDVLTEGGWLVDDTTRPLIALVDSAFADVLVRGTPLYERLLDNIEAKLTTGWQEDIEL